MSPHLKSVPGSVLFVVFYLNACQPNAVVPALPPDHVALVTGESVSTPAGITVHADSVNVSICPPNAACFAPNSTGGTLRLSKGSQSRSVRLFSWIPNYKRQSTSTADSVSVEFDGQRYKVILRDGDYRKGPESTVLPEAVIQVSRL